MKSFCTPKISASRNACRFLLPVVILGVLLSLLTVTSLAAWDGQGYIPDGDNAGAVTGNFSLPYANENDIVGYRFSVYTVVEPEKGDSYITKSGYSIDIHLKTIYADFWHSAGDAKKDHVQYFQEYTASSKKTVSIDELTDQHTVVRGLYNYNDIKGSFKGTLPSDPTKLNEWFAGTDGEENAKAIAVLCGTRYDEYYDESNCYVIVEPIFMVNLESNGAADHYAFTMPELAIIQSGECQGWLSTKLAANSNFGTIINYTSARYGRYLYALGDYPLLDTSPVTGDHLKNDGAGVPSVLLGSSTSINTAYDVLKYQIGMGIYSRLAATNQYRVIYDKNASDATGTTPDSLHFFDVPKKLNENGYDWDGHEFVGWTRNPDGSGTFYEDKQEVVNLVTSPVKTVTIYARWIPDFTDFSFDT